MTSPIFNKGRNGNRGEGGIFGLVYNRLYQSNPQFRDFANSAKGKSIDEVCSQYGVDPSKLSGMSNDDMIDVMAKNGLI